MRDDTGSGTTVLINMQGVRVTFEHAVSASGDVGRGQPFVCDDEYRVTIQLLPQETQTIWRGGEPTVIPPHAGGALFIMNMQERWQCERRGAYDNLVIRIGFSAFRALAHELGFESALGLGTVLGKEDPVMAALGWAWVSVMEAGDGMNSVLMQQLARTIFVHLIGSESTQHAGDGGRRMLSQAQEDAAKAFMRMHAGRNISVTEIAASAGLSRGYFSRAFAATVGATPFRWLMSHRIQRAKDMLVRGLPIADIAAACGFSDQSHLNRVFQRETGISPAQWRKHAGGDV